MICLVRRHELFASLQLGFFHESIDLSLSFLITRLACFLYCDLNNMPGDTLNCCISVQAFDHVNLRERYKSFDNGQQLVMRLTSWVSLIYCLLSHPVALPKSESSIHSRITVGFVASIQQKAIPQ
jgi:hypothetical protein